MGKGTFIYSDIGTNSDKQRRLIFCLAVFQNRLQKYFTFGSQRNDCGILTNKTEVGTIIGKDTDFHLKYVGFQPVFGHTQNFRH